MKFELDQWVYYNGEIVKVFNYHCHVKDYTLIDQYGSFIYRVPADQLEPVVRI